MDSPELTAMPVPVLETIKGVKRAPIEEFKAITKYL